MLINYYHPLSFFMIYVTKLERFAIPTDLQNLSLSCAIGRWQIPAVIICQQNRKEKKKKAEGVRPEEEIKTGRKMGILTSLPSIPKQHLSLMVLFFYNASNQY